ncbi:hypothetical protein Tco_0843435 [Tanacetum coccineum]|uniref:Reverse transcriptase domain-containing protein n=1 Tax=Tanacetum coccineum TaxID=301880 RepID=A0ABQ5B622_9ASTR
MEKEDPADVTKSLANDFNDLIAKLSSDVPVTNGPTGWDDPKVNVHGTKKVGTSCGSDKGSGVVDQNDDVVTSTVKANSTPSFVKVLQGNPIKTVVKIQELRNSEVVDGAAVAILIEAVEEVSSRFANTLYGYFIGKSFFLFQFDTKEGMESVMENGPWLIRLVPLILNEWTPNTILKKDEIKSTSLWVKLHHVPIVAYSQVGLSLITTQLGRPVMLDSYTSNMCLSLWGRNTYARALIDISAEEELKESFVIAISVFDHVDDKCPKRPKVDVHMKDMDDGFTMVEKEETSKNNDTMVNGNVNVTKVSLAVTVQNDPILKKPFTLMDDNVVLKNTFSALTDDEDTGPDTSTILNEDSKCEAIDEELIMECPTSDPNIEGAITPVEKSLMLVILNWRSYVLIFFDIGNGPRMGRGDFNVALSLDDMATGSSNIDISMRKFKECIHDIEVMDPYRISDHAPAVLLIPTAVKVKSRPFKFTNILVHHNRFKEVVLDGWNMSVSAFRMYKIVQKLNNLHDEEAAYVQAFNEVSLMEECFLRQKAKVDWLRDGDANSSYFHKSVKSWVTRSRTVTPLNVSNLFQKCLNEMDVVEMICSVSDKEIKDAVFLMENDKSPGPDGFTAAFFKEAWDIIDTDVINVIREFFVNGKLLKEINHTIIALIPKVASPARVNDFRPISCCNVLFKCITKILSNRIKESLKSLISPNQSAFVPGRSISDNILFTQELMHNYHLDRGSPRRAFKVDIQKAYDTVD